jgi:glucose/arabinose dehydrogenase
VSFTNGAGDSVIRRHAMSGGSLTGGNDGGVDTIVVGQPQSNHNGGQIVFGPDGYLFTSFGDGGGSNDPSGNGQDNSVLLGKILRLDPLPGGGYDTPGDNPLSGPSGREEIWANGVRNPWRFTFDRETRDLWVADVGQNAREEITRLRAADVPTEAGGWGANLGWRLREGDIATPGVGGAPPPGHVGPVHVYGGHSSGCVSITGGHVYRGSDIPALWGTYVYGDYCATNRLSGWRDIAGVEAERFSVSVPGGNLVSFLEDATGELYTISLNGTIARLARG